MQLTTWQEKVIRALYGEDADRVMEWIMGIDGERANAGVNFTLGFSETSADDEWYDSVGLGLAILGKHWDSHVSEEEDAFVLAFADEISPRPEQERD